jgi:hypothetical protein
MACSLDRVDGKTICGPVLGNGEEAAAFAPASHHAIFGSLHRFFPKTAFRFFGPMLSPRATYHL